MITLLSWASALWKTQRLPQWTSSAGANQFQSDGFSESSAARQVSLRGKGIDREYTTLKFTRVSPHYHFDTEQNQFADMERRHSWLSKSAYWGRGETALKELQNQEEKPLV